MKPTVLLLLLLLASAAQAAELDGPAEITAPGYYCLADDLAGGGIRIHASDVLLDGGGHRTVGDRGAGTVGVLVDGPAANVTVANLTVLDWEVGMEFRSVSGGRVLGVKASNCTANGLLVDRCRDVEVRDTAAVRNGYPGIAINGSTRCRVVNATAAANGDVGLYLAGSSDCAVEASTATANLLNGIYLDGARTVAVLGCTLSRNGYPGLAVNGSRGVLIRGNLVHDNRLAEIWLDGTGPSVVILNAAGGGATGLVVRNATAPPWTGGNLWLTPRGVDGRTAAVPSLLPDRALANRLGVAARTGSASVESR